MAFHLNSTAYFFNSCKQQSSTKTIYVSTMHSTLLSFLLQLALTSVAFAAPLTTQSADWRYGTGGGIIGFIIFILDVIVISKSRAPSNATTYLANHACTVEVLQSSRPVSHKVLWSLLVFLFPIVGIVIYWLFSNRAAHKRSGGYEPIGS